MKAFLFSYGGNNDMGDLLALGDYYKVDFPAENEECYGLAFRRDIDISFKDDASEVTIEFKTDKNFKAILEFKTEISKNIPEESFEISAKQGINSFSFPVPHLKSKLKEICFCIFKEHNENLEATVNVLHFSVN